MNWSERSGVSEAILAETGTPLRSWFAAVWYVVHQKQGVWALGLQRVLGLGSYRPAWSWLHKLRRGMELSPGASCSPTRSRSLRARSAGFGPALAVVAPGGRRSSRMRAVDRGERAGRVRMRGVPNVTKDTRTEFVLDHLTRGGEVHTDARQGYNDIGRYRLKHVVTNVSQTGDPAHVALPHVHRVASLVQRWILGTHHGAVSRVQLDYYLDEFTFRFNRRHARHRGLLFYRLLEGGIAADPHPYKTLTAETRT